MSVPAAPLPTGPMTRSLDDIARLFRPDAKAAAIRAREFLQHYPGQRQALGLLVSAHRISGDLSGACAALLEMAEAQPGLAAVHYELGLLLAETEKREDAIAALSRAVALEPYHAQAWRALGDALADSGNAAEANRAYGKCLEVAAARLGQLESEASAEQSRLSGAERMLRARLARDPTDLFALVLLGTVCIRLKRYADAKKPLLRALELASEFAPARKLAAFILPGFTGHKSQ